MDNIVVEYYAIHNATNFAFYFNSYSEIKDIGVEYKENLNDNVSSSKHNIFTQNPKTTEFNNHNHEKNIFVDFYHDNTDVQ